MTGARQLSFNIGITGEAGQIREAIEKLRSELQGSVEMEIKGKKALSYVREKGDLSVRFNLIFAFPEDLSGLISSLDSVTILVSGGSKLEPKNLPAIYVLWNFNEPDEILWLREKQFFLKENLRRAVEEAATLAVARRLAEERLKERLEVLRKLSEAKWKELASEWSERVVNEMSRELPLEEDELELILCSLRKGFGVDCEPMGFSGTVLGDYGLKPISLSEALTGDSLEARILLRAARRVLKLAIGWLANRGFRRTSERLRDIYLKASESVKKTPTTPHEAISILEDMCGFSKPLYVERKGAKKALEKFLRSDKKFFIVVGRSGSGLSWFIIDVAKHLLRSGMDIAVITPEVKFASSAKIALIDGLEKLGPDALKIDAEKIIATCRLSDWLYRREFVEAYEELKEEIFGGRYSIELSAFNEEELKEAMSKYRIRTRLSLLRYPKVLRVFAEELWRTGKEPMLNREMAERIVMLYGIPASVAKMLKAMGVDKGVPVGNLKEKLSREILSAVIGSPLFYMERTLQGPVLKLNTDFREVLERL